jgi:hypothetical protein
MKALIAVIVVAIVAFFAVPMVGEGTTNSCQALERHVVTKQAANIAGGNTNSPVFNTVNNAGQSAANGQIASTMMQQNHPDAPTPISCTYFYWKSLFGA